MEQFIRGLLRDVERRCQVMCQRLLAVPNDPDIADHVLAGYQVAERTRRDAIQLLNDPNLSEPMLLRNHFRGLQELERKSRFIESYYLPFVERFSPSDRRLTRLCRRLTEQVRWPLSPPLIGAFSNQYYWTLIGFNLVWVPAVEDITLLGLPDLCHELGHILLYDSASTLLGNFIGELTSYIAREQLRAVADQRPPEYQVLYNALFAQWRDAWLPEFVSDMVATFLVGPAFGWQHVRLRSGALVGVYHPTLGEHAQHPADEARLRGIIAVLKRMNMAETGLPIMTLWERYLAVNDEAQPPDYTICYPQNLIESLAQVVVAGCRELGLRGCDEPGDTSHIPTLIDGAWEQFVMNPQGYPEWEHQHLEELWRTLDCAA